MTLIRFSAVVAFLAIVLGGCGHEPRHDLQAVTLRLEHLTPTEAQQLVAPHLSQQGTIRYAPRGGRDRGIVTMTIRDHRDNARHAATVVERADVATRNAVLHFQVVRASEAGSLDPALNNMGTVLRELLRFQGYQLVAQTTMNGSPGRRVEQKIDVGDMSLELAVRLNEASGDAVDMVVDLRRRGRVPFLNTNVVVPVGQTVALGSAYPGAAGEALILTVRAERAPSRTRTAARRGEAHDVVDIEIPTDASLREAIRAETAAEIEAALRETNEVVTELHKVNIEALNKDLEQLRSQAADLDAGRARAAPAAVAPRSDLPRHASPARAAGRPVPPADAR